MMRTRLSLLFFVSAGPVVAGQGPFTSSLVYDPDSTPLISTGLTTILTTVFVTRTSLPPPTTVTYFSSSATTITLSLSPSPPETTTTTVHTALQPSSSNDSSNVQNTPMSSGTIVSLPTNPSGSLTRNPGALAGLIIGLCAIVAGLAAFAWFTLKRHRAREREAQAIGPPVMSGVRRGTYPGGMLHRPRIIDVDPDPEIQSSGMGSSPTGHGIVSSFTGAFPRGSQEERAEYESGNLIPYPSAASSNGHSSHGHGTINTRTSSLTQIYPSTRNTSPTLPRQVPNRTRFSLSPDRNAIPSAWNISRSEGPTRIGSVDDVSTISYAPHRVNSEPSVFADAPQHAPIYTRRRSSDVSRADMFPHPGPSILIHPTPQNPPSSLLRPPSATQVPTLQTLQRTQPPGLYLLPPNADEPHPSPAGSNLSVQSGREGLLGTPPHHPTESLSSFRDDLDYSRRIGVGGVVSGLRDSTSVADADPDSEVHPDQETTH